MKLAKANLEKVVATAILTVTLALIWGAALTLLVTLLARGLGA